jgi:hypothetical protein
MQLFDLSQCRSLSAGYRWVGDVHSWTAPFNGGELEDNLGANSWSHALGIGMRQVVSCAKLRAAILAMDPVTIREFVECLVDRDDLTLDEAVARRAEAFHSSMVDNVEIVE